MPSNCMARLASSVLSSHHTKLMLQILLVVAHAAGVFGRDPDQLQDFCVADLLPARSSGNGYPCKDPNLVTVEDFVYGGLANAANLTLNPFQARATRAFVTQWPALNTLGLSLTRLDINPGGVITPHTHNLASEIVFCLEGEVYAGFVAHSESLAGNPFKSYAKIIKKGEAIIFPMGLLHFVSNKGSEPAVTLNFLNSQNPGLHLSNVELFGTGVDPELLAKSFFMTYSQVADLGKFFQDR